MTSATDTYKLLGAFVDELARCGLRDACTSPGSRSTPLVLSLAGDERLSCHSHVDERCAGFFAVGLAKASYRPVALTCTSGTAVANLLPAVVEAREARVPLIVLSADRPPELREVGAGQTIDQLKVFGGFAKWFFEVGTHEATPERIRWIRALACRAFWTAIEDRPGVAHLNFPLREPLVCDELPGAIEQGRPDGAPYVSRPPRVADATAAARALHELIGTRRRGVLVAGRHERDTPLGEASAAFCATVGWPLLADPMSGARRGGAAIAHYDALLREPAFARGHAPEVVVRVGDLPVSKPLRTWLAGLDETRQIVLDPEGVWQDPASVVRDSIVAEPAATLGALTRMLDASSVEPGALDTNADATPADATVTGANGIDPDWLASWRSADERAAEAILGVLATSGLSEPVVAAELGVLLPERATLFVASSMPVRDVETFWPVRTDPPRVLCNRGANGIDGTVSSAFGAAAAERGPVVLLIGDVALAHDLGGLLAAKRLAGKLTIVLLNNEGGGIFDFLPIADSSTARKPEPVSADSGRPSEQDTYTRHISTPTGLDFAQAAALYGLEHKTVADVASFRAALERALAAPTSTMIEVRTARTANVALHQRVWDATAGAIRN